VSFPFILCPTFDSDIISVVNALRAESERRLFAARGPGNKPAAAVGKTKISNRKTNLQPMQGQTPQLTQGQTVTSRTPHGQMPQSTRGQTSQPAQEQALGAQPTQGQTSQLARAQTSQSPEQQTPQTTGPGGPKPPVNGPKRRSGRTPATTATSVTTTV